MLFYRGEIQNTDNYVLISWSIDQSNNKMVYWWNVDMRWPQLMPSQFSHSVTLDSGLGMVGRCDGGQQRMLTIISISIIYHHLYKCCFYWIIFETNPWERFCYNWTEGWCWARTRSLICMGSSPCNVSKAFYGELHSLYNIIVQQQSTCQAAGKC